MNIRRKLYLSFFKKKKKDVVIHVNDIISVNMSNVTVCIRASIKTGKEIKTRLYGKIKVIEIGDTYVLCKYYPYSKPYVEAHIVITNKEYSRIYNNKKNNRRNKLN
jgi:hypothetical protein